MCLYEGDYERASVSSTRVVRARKPHRCDECGTTIPAGEQYEYTWGVWDGDPAANHTHLACAGLRKFIVDVVCSGKGGFVYGGLAEACSEGEMEHLNHDEEGDVPGPLTAILNDIRAKYTAGAVS